MFSKTKEACRYFDQESGCILHLPLEWEVHLNPGKDFSKWGWADSSWETGMFYFTYQDPELKRGILNLFKKVETKNGKYYYQGHRFPGLGSEDMSRDQTITPLAALYHNKDFKELKEIASHLRYRLSKRYRMQTMYFWVKYLAGNKLAGNIFGLCQLVENGIGYSINKLVRKLTGISKSYTPEQTHEDWYGKAFNYYNSNKTKPFTKAWFMRAQPMTPFAVHLSAWMVSCLPNNWIRRANERLIRWEAEESNYLLRILTRDKTLATRPLVAWWPCTSFRWQNRLNTTSYVRFLGSRGTETFRKLDGTFRKSNQDDVLYNALDRDILFAAKERLK